MFIPDQTKADFAELLGDQKTLRKLKKTQGATSGKRETEFEGGVGGIGGIDVGRVNSSDDDCCNNMSRADRREAQKRAAKAISGMKQSGALEKRSWKQVAIGGLILLAMSGGLISTVYTIVTYLTGALLFPFIDVTTDASAIKEIFFGGEPYVVYCQPGRSKAIPKLLVEAGNMLPRGINTAMMNCEDIMVDTDNENVFSRFHLNNKGIQAFVVANGEKPIQFNSNSFYNPDYFVEFVKVQMTPKYLEVERQKDFAVHCTEKQKCVVLGHKGKIKEDVKSSIEYANSYFRKTRIVTVDTHLYSIKLDEVLSASLEAQMKEGKTGKEFLSGLCYSEGRAFVRRLKQQDIYYFLQDCLNDKGLEKIKVIPSVETKKGVRKSSKKSGTKKGESADTKSGEKNKKKDSKKKHAEPKENEKSQYADDGMDTQDDWEVEDEL